jgi:SAM-dependent methyltransferase
MFPLRDFALALPAGARVLDVGCWDASFGRKALAWGRGDLLQAGVDREVPPGTLPPDFEFKLTALDKDPLPFDDEVFDAVVLSHVLEHVPDPVRLVGEAFRVLRSGGALYVETPSERSLLFPSMPFGVEHSRSLNFYDDPTHVGRPQTVQSLHRMFLMFGARVLAVRRIVFPWILLRSPWLLTRALVTKDAALLEITVWRAFGFAVFGTAVKEPGRDRTYVLPPR